MTNSDRRWWVLVAVGTGTLMSALDGSVVNISLPLITQAFDTSVAAVEWVVTTYLVVLSALLLSFGRLGDLYGHKRIYLLGFCIFLVSSALCGLSPSIIALITFRGFQAFGAAMLAANSPAILTKSFPAQKRGQVLGIVATMTYIGLTIGPTIGGYLAEHFGWRMVFYINIPIGLAALAFSAAFIQKDMPEDNKKEFDVPGALAFITGLGSLMLGLNQGHALGWTSPFILLLLSVALVFMGVFILIEKNTASPMLDLSLFRTPLFSLSTATAVLNYICVYSILFLMPFFLMQGQGLSPSSTGLILTAMPVVMAIVAPISGSFSDRVGTRLPAILGLSLLAAGSYLLSRLGPQSVSPQVTLRLGIAGAGIGIFISPNSSALLGSAPLHRRGIASGVLATARNLGMALGVGLTGAIFTTLLSRNGAEPGNALYQSIRYSFLVSTGIAVAAVVLNLIRPSFSPNRAKKT